MSKENETISMEAVVPWSTRNLSMALYVRMKSIAAVRRISMEKVANDALEIGLTNLESKEVGDE